jgi:hypothetical protein
MCLIGLLWLLLLYIVTLSLFLGYIVTFTEVLIDFVLRQGPVLWPGFVLNSWAEATLLSQPPECGDYKKSPPCTVNIHAF